MKRTECRSILHVRHWPCGLIFLFPKVFTEKLFLIRRWRVEKAKNKYLGENFRKGTNPHVLYLSGIKSDYFDAF